MYSLVIWFHIAAGVVALVTYWTAALARKGSPVHRGAGKVFLLAMLAIIATSLVAVARMALKGETVSAVFFGYLLVISATAVVTGWLALRWKDDHARYHGRWYRALALFNMTCGAGVLALGVGEGQVVLMGFSMVGLVRGRAMLKLSRQPVSPRWHLREHLGSMIGLGVAVHVAFLLVGLKRFLPAGYEQSTELIGWLLPLTVAGVAGFVLNRRYAAVPRSKGVSANAP
jgi:uncharacterized membrane protein